MKRDEIVQYATLEKRFDDKDTFFCLSNNSFVEIIALIYLSVSAGGFKMERDIVLLK